MKKKDTVFSFAALFSGTNFSTGMGSVLDLHGSLPRYDFEVPGWMRDAQVLKSDWEQIGDDLWTAISTTREKVPPVAS